MNILSYIDALIIKIESIYFKILCRVVNVSGNLTGFKSTIDPINYILINKPVARNFSIVIQGPIGDESLLVLKRLINQYSEIVGIGNLVISASFISKKTKNYLELKNIKHVEVAADPKGPKNILVQSRSILEGIKLCKTDLVVRTRLDQFVSDWSFIDTYAELILDNKVMSGGYTLTNPIFHVGDMFQFGRKSLLKDIWGNISNENLVEDIRSQMHVATKDYSYMDAGELYFGLAIAKYFNLEITKLNYLKLLSDHMIIVSNQDIGMQWAKYNTLSDFKKLNLEKSRDSIGHIKWTGLINNKIFKNEKN